MTPEERFRRIDSLLDEALGLDAGARPEFLQRACGADEALRREVESLLEASQAAGSFLVQPAIDAAARDWARRSPSFAGRSIGPYSVESLIGAGGMGEVYLARDPRLGRNVAIKVLAPHLSQDKDALARFEREARAVAALSHPNILAIHEFGTSVEGDAYAVMELLDGETLRTRLGRSPLPWRKAVGIARQIADGLAAAHAKGIVHRDLKPENIFLVASDQVKILDFGLARVTQGASPMDPTAGATSVGTIMGTTGYMSPEQVRGGETKPASDIFSFGCVLYEMLCGTTPFARPTAAETLAAILRDDPPRLLDRVSQVPEAVDAIVMHCLEKQVSDRFQSAKDMAFALQAASGTGSAAVPARQGGRLKDSAWRWLAVSALVAIGVALTLWLANRGVLLPVAPVRFTFAPPGVWVTTELENQILAVSPDGRAIAFVAVADGQRSLWVRARDVVNMVRLAGTEGAASPFWSPDSRSIAFLVDGTLKRVAASGGPPQVIGEVPFASGCGTWGTGGTILFGGLGGGQNGIFQISASGGSPTRLTSPDASKGESWHLWPQFLPDGQHFLYLADTEKNGDNILRIASIDGGAPQDLSRGASRAEFVDAGYLLYVRDGTLLAHPFDPETRRFTGEPMPIADQIQSFLPTGYAAFSGSNGVLAYTSGAVTSRITWFDRIGRKLGAVGPLADHEDIRISPDRRTVVTSVGDPQRGTRDLWIYDLTGNATTRFTTTDGNTEYSPIWSPDGQALGFAADLAAGPPNLHRKSLHGTDPPQALLSPAGSPQWADDWSPDGSVIVYEESQAATRRDLKLLTLAASRAPTTLLSSSFNESQARFSPDGRWLTYASDESGRSEIYMRSLTGTPQKWQISHTGGAWPVWRRDGKELYYISGDMQLTAVRIDAARVFSARAPEALFKVDPAGSGTMFDVSDDGQRFLVNNNVARAESMPVTVVVGWWENLRR